MRQSDSSEGTRVGWKTRKTRSLLRGPRAHVITEEKSMRISREEQKKKNKKNRSGNCPDLESPVLLTPTKPCESSPTTTDAAEHASLIPLLEILPTPF